jgi:hypothetical protein
MNLYVWIMCKMSAFSLAREKVPEIATSPRAGEGDFLGTNIEMRL